MSAYEDRLRDAKAIPILEVAERVGVPNLMRMGVERVGPCPVCGGKDRFSINPNLGVFNCRRCDKGGDGVALAEHVLGCDFKRALDFLVGDAAPEIDERARRERAERARAEAARKERYAARARAHAISDARRIWLSAHPGAGTAAQAYLAGRGITFDAWPPTLKFLPDHPMIKRLEGMDRAEEIHRGPAMIAAIQGPDGKVAAVHQTWIDPDRPGKKVALCHPETRDPLPAKLVRGSKKGGAIRLGKVEPGATLVMGEGIETTASAMMIWNAPRAVYWAGVDLGNMAGRQVKVPGKRYSGDPDMADDRAFIPPAGLAKLIYLQDGDSHPADTRAKLLAGLRRAMRTYPGLETAIASAPEGKDFNDIIN